MAKGDFLGEFEQIVLLAVARLGPDAYGMSIRQEIEARTARDVAIGSVYSALERMEAKGYVTSCTGEPTPERGGRAKRYYRLEEPGLRALRVSLEAVNRLLEGLRVDLGESP